MKKKKNKNKKFYLTDGITILLLFCCFAIIYSIFVALFLDRVNEKNGIAFEVITGISSLIFTFGTVFYVVKTFIAQKNEIKIQKKEIEFNRILDLIYKQLDHSKEKLKYLAQKEVKNIIAKDLKGYFPHYSRLHIILETYEKELKLCDSFFKNTNLSKKNKNLLYGAFLTNINDEIEICFKKFYEILKGDETTTTILSGAINGIMHTEITKKFKFYAEKQLIKDYRESVNFSYDLNSNLTETISDNEILEKRTKEVDQKVLVFKNCITLANEISKFYNSYNGW
ncbi:hypothetical protein [Sphingobacterium sp.]|uniref:hypothetical protein n=1 Tax=Sphingobacterium sp. TaxID=341027 RepID=UPI0031E26AF8